MLLVKGTGSMCFGLHLFIFRVLQVLTSWLVNHRYDFEPDIAASNPNTKESLGSPRNHPQLLNFLEKVCKTEGYSLVNLFAGRNN